MNEAWRDKHIILYDGLCNLCHFSVQFVLKRDREKKFYFCHLDSPIGRSIKSQLPNLLKGYDSIIYWQKGVVYQKSDAVFRIVYLLDSRWKYLSVFHVIPHTFRDYIYDLIAHSRYAIFGKKDQCIPPNPKDQSRFL